jgi:hypothetical protein
LNSRLATSGLIPVLPEEESPQRGGVVGGISSYLRPHTSSLAPLRRA